MTEDIQSVLKKVKKLLKLAEGKANAEESASAAAKAQELIDKYKLEMTDLEAQEMDAEQISEETVRSTGKLVAWQAQLATILSKANSCRAYVLDGGRNKRIQVVGTRSNSEIVKYLFSYLSREINKLTAAAIRNLELDGEDYGVQPKSYGHAFRLGCVKAIFLKLEAQKAQLRQEYSSTALMRLDNQLARVDDHMKQVPNLKNLKQGLKPRADGFAAGLIAGSSIALNKGLGGSNAAAIGAGRKLLG